MISAAGEKWIIFKFFQFRERVVVRRGQIRRIDLLYIEAHVDHFLLGCKFPESWRIAVPAQDTLGEIPMSFFHQNIPQLHQQ
jgi:hypothetical protein